MSDDRRTFEAKTDKMFAVFRDQLNDITKLYQVKIVSAVIRHTYGPGNQWHATAYEATGRLRAGWRWGSEPPPETVSQLEGGPFDAEGTSTAANISLRIIQSDIAPTTWAYNEVAYAWLVHEGKGGHKDIGPRPWVEIVAANGQDYLHEARRDVMAGSR